MKRVAAALACSCVLAGSGCAPAAPAAPDAKTVRLRGLAESLAAGADQCLYDVRDRNYTYENSSYCALLTSLSSSYTAAGGFQPAVPPEIALIAEKATTTAWMARATSLAGGRPIRVW